MADKDNNVTVRYVIIGTAVVFALVFGKPSIYVPPIFGRFMDTLLFSIFLGVTWYVVCYHVLYKNFFQKNFAIPVAVTTDASLVQQVPFLMTQTPYILHGLLWVVLVYLAIADSMRSCFLLCFGPSAGVIFIVGTIGVILATFGLKRAQRIFLSTHSIAALWGNYIWYLFVSAVVSIAVVVLLSFSGIIR